jgi:hypothetical protein
MGLTSEALNKVFHKFTHGNRGFTRIPECISKCPFITIQSKQLYCNLLQHAYWDKQISFPSQELLAIELGVSVRSLIAYVKELRSCGLITTTKRKKHGLNYHINDITGVTTVIHGNIIWRIYNEIFTDEEKDNPKFHTVINSYKESELCKKVKNCNNPDEYYNEIRQFFYCGLGVPLKPDSKECISEEIPTNSDSLCDGIMSELEEYVNHFYKQYELIKGEKMSCSKSEHRKNLEDMYIVYKRCGQNAEELFDRIKIFINTDWIDYCSIRTFSKSGIQSAISRSISKRLDYIEQVKYKDKSINNCTPDAPSKDLESYTSIFTEKGLI